MGSENVDVLLSEPLREIINKDVIMLEANKTANDAIKIMKEKNVRCVLITHNEEAVGIVTKSDILFKVISQKIDLNKASLRSIMSSPVIMLPASSKVSDALDVMNKHNIRQIFVGSNSAIIGIVNREELLELIHKASMNISKEAFSGAPVCIINPKAATLINDASKPLTCPYCDSEFTYKEELSRHIDRMHIGSGALEGDMRRIFE